jgi:hypothetical protein
MGRLMNGLKALGLRDGWPDLDLCLPGGPIPFVEVKTVTGTLSDDQTEVHAAVRCRGFAVWVLPDSGRPQALAERIVMTGPCGSTRLKSS